MGFVLSEFENRMVLWDLTMVRFRSRLVMISFIITVTKWYLKAAPQIVNWVYSASTRLSFSSKEKPEISFQKGNWVIKECDSPRKPSCRILCDKRSMGWILLRVPNLVVTLLVRLWNQPYPFVRVLAIIIHQQKSFTTVIYHLRLSNRAVLS